MTFSITAQAEITENGETVQIAWIGQREVSSEAEAVATAMANIMRQWQYHLDDHPDGEARLNTVTVRVREV